MNITYFSTYGLIEFFNILRKRRNGFTKCQYIPGILNEFVFGTGTQLYWLGSHFPRKRSFDRGWHLSSQPNRILRSPAPKSIHTRGMFSRGLRRSRSYIP